MNTNDPKLFYKHCPLLMVFVPVDTVNSFLSPLFFFSSPLLSFFPLLFHPFSSSPSLSLPPLPLSHLLPFLIGISVGEEGGFESSCSHSRLDALRSRGQSTQAQWFVFFLSSSLLLLPLTLLLLAFCLPSPSPPYPSLLPLSPLLISFPISQ